jgi:hypothetical protein
MLYRDLAYLEAIDFGRSMLVFAGSSRMVPSFSAGRLVRRGLEQAPCGRADQMLHRSYPVNNLRSVFSNTSCLLAVIASDHPSPKSHHTAHKGEHFSC